MILFRQFTEKTFDEAYAYNELISFTMDVIDILGEDLWYYNKLFVVVFIYVINFVKIAIF